MAPPRSISPPAYEKLYTLLGEHATIRSSLIAAALKAISLIRAWQGCAYSSRGSTKSSTAVCPSFTATCFVTAL